jgi:carotenoid cleavage dioxygenase-like enzyme
MNWRERWFALHETGLPVEIDRELATLGETDFGVLGECFSAHPKLVGDRIYNFAMRYGAQTRLELYELGVTARTLGSLPLDGAAMIHDFVATEHHLIFFVPPLRLRPTDLAAGYCYSDALEWRPELGTEVIVVPLDASDSPIRFTTDPFHLWHFANAFERGGELVVDFVRYPDFGSNRWFASMTTGRPWREVRQGSLARATISLSRRAMQVEARSDALVEFPHVSPRVATRSHEVVYAVAHTAPAEAHDRIVRIDATGEVIDAALEAGQFPDEPVFVPRRGATTEDDGWLLAVVYDARAHASHVAIFDARRLEAGPVGRAWYDHHIPFTFHGLWI